MLARSALVAASFALVAAAPLAAKEKKAEPALASAETVTCDGVFGRKSSEALVKETFGADNVETGMVSGPEGMEVLATTVYPTDPKRMMEFSWWDEEKLEYLGSMDLSPSQQTPTGVRIGMTVAEVEAINGAPFTVGGFWWDYGGAGVFEKGKLVNPDEGCGFWIRFAPKDDYPADLNVDAVAGEVTVPSSEPLLKTLDVRVQSISLGYPYPDELPQQDH